MDDFQKGMIAPEDVMTLPEPIEHSRSRWVAPGDNGQYQDQWREGLLQKTRDQSFHGPYISLQ